MNKILINIQTGNQVKEGDKVTTFRGEQVTLVTARPNEGRNGKVYVSQPSKVYGARDGISCYYPDVIGCEFREP